jgi:hypothetical protein
VLKRPRGRFYRVDSSGHPYSRMLLSFVRRAIDVNALEQCLEGHDASKPYLNCGNF